MKKSDVVKHIEDMISQYNRKLVDARKDKDYARMDKIRHLKGNVLDLQYVLQMVSDIDDIN